jgi:hypothetical protein
MVAVTPGEALQVTIGGAGLPGVRSRRSEYPAGGFNGGGRWGWGPWRRRGVEAPRTSAGVRARTGLTCGLADRILGVGGGPGSGFALLPVPPFEADGLLAMCWPLGGRGGASGAPGDNRGTVSRRAIRLRSPTHACTGRARFQAVERGSRFKRCRHFVPLRKRLVGRAAPAGRDRGVPQHGQGPSAIGTDLLLGRA